MSAHLNLVVIRARDLQASRRFYEALGLSFTEERHGRGPAHLACDLGGQVLELYPRRSDADDTSAVRLGFTVASLRGTLEELERHGAGVTSRETSSAVVRDPDGHAVELREAP